MLSPYQIKNCNNGIGYFKDGIVSLVPHGISTLELFTLISFRYNATQHNTTQLGQCAQ